MKVILRRAALLLLTVATLSGCDIGGGNIGPTPSVGTNPNSTLRWAIEGVSDLQSLDPPLTNSTQQVMVENLIFEGLVKLDSRFNIQPAGAVRWEVSADSRVFTFHIRPNLKFADGSDCTATDFAYSLNRALSKQFASGQARYYLGNISGSAALASGSATSLSGVQTLDNLTLRITLTVPASYFLYQLTFPSAFVVPHQAVEQYGDQWDEYAYGTGPFMLKRWQHGKSLSLVPNSHYYGGNLRLQAIEMPLYAQPASAFAAYQQGDLDIMGTQGFDPTNLDLAQKLPGFVQAAQFNNTYVGFNNLKAPFDRVAVRQALAQALDKQTLASRALTGTVEAADTIVPPGMPGYNATIQRLAYSPAAAQSTLSAGGFPQGKGFPVITLTINGLNPAAQTSGQFLAQAWRTNLGISVNLQVEDLTRFSRDLDILAANPISSSIEMYLSTWSADYPDPQNFLSQQLRSGVGNNNGHYSNPDFDRLVDQADAESNLSMRIPIYQQAEQIAINDVGWLPLYYGKAYALISPHVQGLTYTAQGLFADDWTQVTVQ